MRDDIVGALRNALERGTSLEQAIQSFINAGYRETEVREAAQFVQTGALAITTLPQTPKKTLIPIKPMAQAPVTPPVAQPIIQTVQVQQQEIQPLRKKRTPWLLITLLGILGFLVIFLVLSLLYKQQIIDFFKTL